MHISDVSVLPVKTQTYLVETVVLSIDCIFMAVLVLIAVLVNKFVKDSMEPGVYFANAANKNV